MKMKDRIIFHWTDNKKVRRQIATTSDFFKSYAIELLEQEQLDEVTNIWYTLNNEITKKLDYYNEKL